MAIPISAIAALGQLGAGAINYFAGRKQKKQGEELYNQQLKDLRSGKFDLELSGAQTQAANLARQYGEQIARQTGERGTAAQQAALMAARGGDPRMAAGLGSQVAASDRAVQEAQMGGLATSIGAQQNLADIQQDLTTQNQQFRQGLEAQEMQRGGAAAEAGRQQQFGGISQMIQSPITGAAVHQQMPNVGLGLGGYQTMDDGGMITPGPFSHDRNPIHLIDDDGDKVGEATGGEIIFNPEQTATIEDLVDGGQAYRLMLYMKNLLDQPQFQESTMAAGGGFVHSGKAFVDYDVSNLLKDKSEGSDGESENTSTTTTNKTKEKNKSYNRKRFRNKFKRRKARYERRNERKLNKGYKEFLKGQKKDDREIARQERQDERMMEKGRRKVQKGQRRAVREDERLDRQQERINKRIENAQDRYDMLDQRQQEFLNRGFNVSRSRKFNRMGRQMGDLAKLIGTGNLY